MNTLRLKPDEEKGFPGFQTPTCIPTTGETPDSLPGQTYTFNSPNETFSGAVNGASQVSKSQGVGVMTTLPEMHSRCRKSWPASDVARCQTRAACFSSASRL